jgi:hypothetical protein
MAKSKNYWKWPVRKDEIFYDWSGILGRINPKMVNKRGFF